jgi:hypothetical protein
MTTSLEIAESNRHWEQYKELRNTFKKITEDIRKLEIYAVTAVAALYAWLLKEGGQHLPWFAYYIAFPVVFLAWLKALNQIKRIKTVDEYLVKIEGVFFKDQESLPGWQHFARNASIYLLAADKFFWICLFAFTLLAPIILRSLYSTCIMQVALASKP